MNEKQLSGAAVRNGGCDRAITGDNGAPGFFEGCLLILRRGLRKVFVLPGPGAAEQAGHQDHLRSSTGVVHNSPSPNRRNAERDLAIYFDYMDQLTVKYIAKKYQLSTARIYQIVKQVHKESERII